MAERKISILLMAVRFRSATPCGIDWRDQRRAHNPFNIRADLVSATKKTHTATKAIDV